MARPKKRTKRRTLGKPSCVGHFKKSDNGNESIKIPTCPKTKTTSIAKKFNKIVQNRPSRNCAHSDNCVCVTPKQVFSHKISKNSLQKNWEKVPLHNFYRKSPKLLIENRSRNGWPKTTELKKPH